MGSRRVQLIFFEELCFNLWRYDLILTKLSQSNQSEVILNQKCQKIRENRQNAPLEAFEGVRQKIFGVEKVSTNEDGTFLGQNFCSKIKNEKLWKFSDAFWAQNAKKWRPG